MAAYVEGISAGLTLSIVHSGGVVDDTNTAVCDLQGDFGKGHQGIGGTTNYRWTHVMLLGPTVDIRDDYKFADESTAPVTHDNVYIPDAAGVKYQVVFVERIGRGTASDHKRVYLKRQAVTWPSDNV